MNNSDNTLTINVLGRDFQVKCASDQVRSLEEAALYLNQRIRDIKASGKVIDYDRILVMAALNLAHELMGYEAHQDQQLGHIKSRLESIHNKVTLGLSKAIEEITQSDD